MSDPGVSPCRGLYEILDDTPDRYRLLALYTTDQERQAVPPPDASDQPISLLFEGSRLRRFYDRRPSMFPVSTLGKRLDAGALGLPAGIEACRAIWLHVRFPSGLVLGVLGLSFDLRGPDVVSRSTTLVALRMRLDFARATLPLGGDEDALGPDFHQVLLVPQSHAAEFGPDPLAEDVQRLVATQTDGVRPGFQSARMPRDVNRYFGMIGAVTPGASVLGGQDEHTQRACFVAAMQAIAALGSVRGLFDRAYSEIAAYRVTLTTSGAARLDRSQAARLAEEVRALQLNLSYEVESHQEVRLCVPLLPVEEFHAELSNCLGMANASRTTSRMVERLAAALDADLGRLSLEEADDNATRSRRVEAWVIGLTVLATVSVPITLILALLGSNVREITSPDGSPPSIWELRLLPYYVALVVIPAALGFAAWMVSRRSLGVDDRRARPHQSTAARGHSSPTSGVE
jgi:hypothetical protein